MKCLFILPIFFLVFLFWTFNVHADPNLKSIEESLEAGEYKQAARDSKKLIKEEPSNVKAWVLLGNAYVGREKDKKAIAAFQKALQLDPNSEDAYLGLGSVFTMMRNYSSAIEAYKKIIEINPKNAQAHFQLGVNYHRVTKLTQAFEEYKILKTLDERLAGKLHKIILGG